MTSPSRVPERGITPRATSFPDWYQDVIAAAELLESAPVRGCFILRPAGYAIWENIQREMDARFKALGVKNAYFPVLIPESYIKREADHVEGFSPELAVVTHAGGEALEEPLVVRPTSETIIWATYRRWIQSHRDLPLLLNQWANVMRWEKRPRAFLRTTEFLWQEGHTAHATAEDAQDLTMRILRLYVEFADEVLALAPLAGEKPAHERFAGAVATYSMEPMMQDGRALQAGTSHYLGETFARAFDVRFQTKDGASAYVQATSWGVSTRLIGGLVMVHGDDNGIVLPPRIAPDQVVIVPVEKEAQADASPVMATARQLAAALTAAGVRAVIDTRLDQRLGARLYAFERTGAPLRLEFGARELTSGAFTAVCRHDGSKHRVPVDTAVETVTALLATIQRDLRARALAFRESRTVAVETRAEFDEAISAGYALARWCEQVACAKEIQEATRATLRCYPFTRTASGDFQPLSDDPGPCAACGQPARRRVIAARAY